MSIDPRKVFVVASSEFVSTVQTKAFLVSLLAMPALMFGSIAFQTYFAKKGDVQPRRFAVIDDAGTLRPAVAKAVEAYDASLAAAKAGPRFILEETPSGADRETVLSRQVREGKLDAYVEIPADLASAAPGASSEGLKYHSNNPNDDVLRRWLSATVDAEVRGRRFREAGIDQALAARLSAPTPVGNYEVAEESAGGKAGAGEKKVDPIRSIATPAALMLVVFLVVMITCPQLLNSVIEEKMSRISEVLLGSVGPFELMLGKLLGNVGTAAVLAGIYLAGAYGVASYFGYADVVTPGLVLGLAVFLLLAIFLYGSLYMAVGAACNDLKEAQSLMMPVLILSMLPMFVWTSVLQNPSSPTSVGMSLFPPASPYLMLMRMAMKPTPPAWQVVAAVVLTTATALACVWAGGRIFRVGLLMQGKAPSFAELARWIVKR